MAGHLAFHLDIARTATSLSLSIPTMESTTYESMVVFFLKCVSVAYSDVENYEPLFKFDGFIDDLLLFLED